MAKRIKDTSIFQGVCEFEAGGDYFRVTDGDGIPARQIQILSVYIYEASSRSYIYRGRVVSRRNPTAIYRAWQERRAA